MRFFIRVLVSGLALWFATLIVPGLEFAAKATTGEVVLTIAVVAVFFTLVNMLIRPIVVFLALPLYILTLGLFSLVVNALMLLLTGWISAHTEFLLNVDGFLPAFFGGIVIAIASWILNATFPQQRS
ncbi:MAG: phage holin family protein [Bowdeniella nasicola]|nr:phage holin family protein [Bowdeniella nasicola]